MICEMLIILTIYLMDGVLADTTSNDTSYRTDTSYNAEERAVKTLMTTINSVTSHTRPVAKVNDTVDVRMSISLNHILDFDEKNQVLTTMIWKSLIWQDKRLSWDPETHDGLRKVTLPPKLIWTPDIVLYNSMDMKMAEDDRYWLILNHEGLCEWIPAVVHKSVCHVDMENFPYDTQHCHLKFGSWAHNEQQVNLTLDPHTNGLDLSTYTSSMEWELTSAYAERNAQKYECCPEVFVDITYTFTLVRQSAFYTQFLIIPIVLLSGMVFTIFWIPPTRPDRTGLGLNYIGDGVRLDLYSLGFGRLAEFNMAHQGTVVFFTSIIFVFGMSLFASFMLLLLLVVQISPPSKSIKLVTYCCFNIIMIAAATLLSTIVVNLSHTKRPLPQCLKKIQSVLFTITRRKSVKRNSSDHCINVENNGKEDSKTPTSKTKITKTNLEQWQSFALLLDRTFFIVFFICSLVLMILYLPKPL